MGHRRDFPRLFLSARHENRYRRIIYVHIEMSSKDKTLINNKSTMWKEYVKYFTCYAAGDIERRVSADVHIFFPCCRSIDLFNNVNFQIPRVKFYTGRLCRVLEGIFPSRSATVFPSQQRNRLCIYIMGFIDGGNSGDLFGLVKYPKKPPQS
jgi:hypothetical protein